MKRAPSLTSRAILAVALMFGFYILAFVIVGILLYLPYAEIRYAHRLHIKLAIGCIVGAGIVLWSIIPRRDKFEPPGPLLNEKQHPKLFKELKEVAADTNQEMPKEVYLIPEINAWVAERGGVMAFGSRRVMGIGLPLLQVLNISQFKGILAHEFGHFYGGDTKLGPWVYKTRAAIGRTLQGLASRSSALRMPFVWYGNMFLRITHTISRQQEYTADALAARTIGTKSMIEGLKAIYSSVWTFEKYWIDEFAPVLQSGFVPPLIEGFSKFVSAPQIGNMMSTTIDKYIKEKEESIYDTHPHLFNRIEALEEDITEKDALQKELAITLLSEDSEIEGKLLNCIVGEEHAKKLEKLKWEQVGEQVYIPMWRDAVKEYPRLKQITAGQLPEVVTNLEEFAEDFKDKIEAELPEDLMRKTVSLLSIALALTLIDNGWKLSMQLGEEVICSKNSSQVAPFKAVNQLVQGELSAKDWQRQCEIDQISDILFLSNGN